MVNLPKIPNSFFRPALAVSKTEPQTEPATTDLAAHFPLEKYSEAPAARVSALSLACALVVKYAHDC